MATHILWQADVADFDAWLDVFKQDKPARLAAGIVDLNIWRDPERENHAVALFAIQNLDHARAFFDSENRSMHRERGGLVNVVLKLLTPA